jgi:hypothetical protein
MAFAKVSVVQLIMRLSQRRSKIHTACHIANGVIALWTLFSILSLAFQCQLPDPWVYTPQRCAGSGAVWYPVVVVNLLTDTVLSFLFAPVLWKLKMSRTQRLTITSLFSVRLTYVLGPVNLQRRTLTSFQSMHRNHFPAGYFALDFTCIRPNWYVDVDTHGH